MFRLELLAAAVLAAACSPHQESDMANRSVAAVPEPLTAVLTAERPRADLPGSALCGSGGLAVEIADRSASPNSAGAYLLTLTAILAGGERRRIAAHTPYPTGSGGRLIAERSACQGAEALIIEAEPIHGSKLGPGTRLEIAVSPMEAPGS